ncbi:AT-rich interactive domain-containing protein 3A-like [Columba livia]|uniref:AT-rich interactive domain-containing protein 3A-like n=1 Tax=Columba livia TaxID=8932 RepID=UPI0031BA88B4
MQHSLPAMASKFPVNIKISNRDDRQETTLKLSNNGISSINMSIEIMELSTQGLYLLLQYEEFRIGQAQLDWLIP